MKEKIRILMVDDSMFFRASMAKALRDDPDIEVIGEAFDPYDARDKILDLEPDLMLLDVEMPYMNGVEFLKVLLPQWPIPVIVVSSAERYAAEAMKAGARDFLAKPESRSPDSFAQFTAELIKRIKVVSSSAYAQRYRVPVAQKEPLSAAGAYRFQGIIALGASTGGTQATTKILKQLPGDIPGMVIVQHMPPDFTRMYAENLDKDCAMTIQEARDGDLIERGKVLLAPGDQHMEVVKKGTNYCVRCFKGDKVNGHCPSVDVLFNSVAQNVGRNALGIILTGMGSDGARGLLAMRKTGSFTIGQDQQSCVVYGMPKEAFDMGAVARQCSLDTIPSVLMGYLKN